MRLAALLPLTLVAAQATGGCERAREEATATRLALEPDLDDQELEFLRLINEYRVSFGVPELAPVSEINGAADAHSEDMGRRGYFAHEAVEPAPHGTEPWDRMCDFGFGPACDRSTAMAENIAAGHSDARSTFLAWRGSEGHDANMRDPAFRGIGVGRVLVEGSLYLWYWTSDFAGVAPDCVCADGQRRSCETGDCGPGLAECQDCIFGPCEVPARGDEEICADGFDNNCDGVVDEEDPCGPYCEASVEVCDGLDNDCDGATDEGTVCDVRCLPLDEVCDGLDNDCDFAVDEGCPCDDRPQNPFCGIDEGRCSTGSQECDFGEEGGTLTDCRGAIAPEVEICDGLDNDCDGIVDEREVCAEAVGCSCSAASLCPFPPLSLGAALLDFPRPTPIQG